MPVSKKQSHHTTAKNTNAVVSPHTIYRDSGIDSICLDESLEYSAEDSTHATSDEEPLHRFGWLTKHQKAPEITQYATDRSLEEVQVKINQIFFAPTHQSKQHIR